MSDRDINTFKNQKTVEAGDDSFQSFKKQDQKEFEQILQKSKKSEFQ